MEKMLACIKHRGPDDTGIESFDQGSIVLGHRRLSIVDLSTSGHQPMTYGNTDKWVVFNGEVYNYIELRCELSKMGYQFKSKSDTEVVLAAYDAWQETAFDYFNGMWAIAIWDNIEKRMLVCRDRFGIKPLYYYVNPGRFIAFASEIKQFMQLPGWKSEMNLQMVYDYLVPNLMDHTSETMFKSVKQLRGGEIISLDLKSTQSVKPELPIRKWWFVGDNDDNEQVSFKDSIEQFSHIFSDAVRLRLRADVPIGSCLSGGLDSSSIVCVVNSILRKISNSFDQKTISASFNESAYNEQHYVDAVALQIGITPCKIFPKSEDIAKKIDRIIWHNDEPICNATPVTQWCVFEEAARHNVKVMLDGQGADEILAGYHNYFGIFFIELVKSLKLKILLNEMRIYNKRYKAIPFSSLIRMAKSLAAFIFNGALHHTYYKTFKDWINFEYFEASDVDVKRTRSHFGEAEKGVGAFSKSQLVHLGMPWLLHLEDRNSMAHSIESRVPFLDHRLVSYTINLPSQMKIQNGETKKILRLAMQDIVPQQILNRTDKMGFATPESDWVKKLGRSLFRQTFSEASDLPFINGEKLLNHFEEMMSGKRKYSSSIFSIFTLIKWVKSLNVII